MPLTADIKHADGDVSRLRVVGADELGDERAPSLTSARIERHLTRSPQQTDSAEVVVYRDAWRDVEAKLDRRNDRLLIRNDGDILFGGRVADWEVGGVLVSVLADGPKRDALDAEPSGPNDVLNGQADSAIVDTIIDRVPTVETRLVETVAKEIPFAEVRSSPGASLAKLARDADAEVAYRATPDSFEVDYISRLGNVRGVNITPADATVIGEPTIREQVAEDVTHVRVLGAGRGSTQIEAEAVAADFNGGREVYRKTTDKDIQRQARAEQLAETLVNEHDGSREFLEVDAALPPSVAPSVGDTFDVSLPEAGIDESLRATRVVHIFDEGGERFEATLSNRRHTARRPAVEDEQSIDEFRESDPGQYFAISVNEGWFTIDTSDEFVPPTLIRFSLPENTLDILKAELRIRSRPYKAKPESGAVSTNLVPQDVEVVFNVDTIDKGLTHTEDNPIDETYDISGDLREGLNFLRVGKGQQLGDIRTEIDIEGIKNAART